MGFETWLNDLNLFTDLRSKIWDLISDLPITDFRRPWVGFNVIHLMHAFSDAFLQRAAMLALQALY